MQSTYKYRFDHSTIYWTLIYIIVFVLLGGLLYHLYEGGYLSAWFTSFIVALVALMSLSIPRTIVVSDETVEVRCLLDITEIRRDEIASVRRVDPKRMKWFLPIFGGCGFFGYYGHFIDLRRLDRVRLYASEWRNFVEITDIYEDRLYVSCADADRLGISIQRCLENAQLLRANPQVREKVVAVYAEAEPFVPSENVDAQLYNGFFSDADRAAMKIVLETEPRNLPALDITFADQRIERLLFNYRARNFPGSLDEAEQQRWLEHRREVFTPAFLQAYADELQMLYQQHQQDSEKLGQLKALWQYAQDIV